MPGARAQLHLDDAPRAEPGEVREALARVTASDAFRGAPQLASFLTYIVAMALDGRGNEIKGYSIATQALGRDPDFDPQTDPIVRVEAMRLRRALEAYYAETGAADRLRIVIPRGSYVPVFEPVEAAPAPTPAAAPDLPALPEPAPVTVLHPAAAPTSSSPPPSRWPWRVAAGAAALAAGIVGFAVLPTGPGPRSAPILLLQPHVVVAPVEGDGGAEAARLRDDLVDALAAFDEVVVREPGAGRRTEPGSYELAVRIAPGEGAPRVRARLTAGADGRVVWTRDLPLAGDDAPRRLAALLAQPHGVLMADWRAHAPAGARCLAQAVDYGRAPTRERHLAARTCLEAAVAASPRSAVLRAHLARVVLDEARLGFNPRGDASARALAQAREAQALRPESPRALQALMEVLFARGDMEAAVSTARAAVSLSPDDAELRAAFGRHLVQAGRFQEGTRELAAAIAASPAPPAWYGFPLAVASWMTGDLAGAEAAARRIDAAQDPWGHLARALVAKAGGRDEEARAALAELRRARPGWRGDLAALLAHPPTLARVEAELGPLAEEPARPFL